MDPYIKLQFETPEEFALILRDIIRKREFDVEDFNKIGSTVNRVPSSSTNVLDNEQVGATAYDSGYFYVLVDDSGPTWKRTALSSF